MNDFVWHAIQVAARGLSPPWLGKAPAEACRASEILGSTLTCVAALTDVDSCNENLHVHRIVIELRAMSLQLEMTHALHH